VLCAVLPRVRRTSSTLEHQLLQLTLGDPAPALFVAPDRLVTSCNPAAEQLFGYSADELVGMPVGMLFRDPREILDILSQQILDPAKPYSEDSAIIRRQDGALVQVRFKALLLADGEYKVVGFLVQVQEQQHQRGEGEPSSRMLMQHRLATMGELAAQMAHEIRNPLVAIGASLNSLCQEDLPQEPRSILRSLAQEISRLDIVLRDYTSVAQPLAFSEVKLREVAQEAHRLLQGDRKAAGKQLSVQIDGGLTVRGDHDSLKQVLFNLLLNALEASPDGGEVTCRAEASEQEVTLLVEDRGAGLTASAVECLRPFFTTKQDGSGLGLAVCQKIARTHGGLVELQQRPGGGCQARVILPRRDARGERRLDR
jgi:PAS domain S-box-containing protein